MENMIELGLGTFLKFEQTFYTQSVIFLLIFSLYVGYVLQT